MAQDQPRDDRTFTLTLDLPTARGFIVRDVTSSHEKDLMSGKRKQRPSQKMCVFCGGLPLSKEHFWPEWSASYMPNTDTHTMGRTRGQVGGADEETLKNWSRQGHVGVITVRVVCETCNNVWMNREEERVRPFLEPMLKGESVLLSPEMQDALATYVTMKVMVSDHNTPEIAGFSPSEYSNFYLHRTIPKDLTITLFMFTSPFFNVSMYNREYAADSEKVGWERTLIANFTYRFGSMFIQALLRRGQGLMDRGQFPFMIPLNPRQGRSRSWPLFQQLDEKIAYQLQHWAQFTEGGGLLGKYPGSQTL